MHKGPNDFKAALASGKRQVGCFLSIGSPTATEIVAGAGFDWLLIDMEHAVNELPDILNHLRAAQLGTAEPAVRVPWNDPIVVKRLLDIGVRTLLFPYIENAEEARQAVASTRYHPQGTRGFAGGTRATAYGRDTTYAKHSAQDTCVLVQVETPAAIAAIPEIADVDGVDGIFIGPNDLATNLGHMGNLGAPAVRDAIASALAAIRKGGKPAGILSLMQDQSRSYFDAGFIFIGATSDTFMLARQAEQVVTNLKA